ncbi:discoidin domain-containing protein [Campylobacter lari]|uniref:discoidin domain-containing protein n=1 Tax=Campylobacter lari TaxID=201 RepID=UPI00156EE33A|nr:discoidin domain-containing protein [Campylobacter lari]
MIWNDEDIEDIAKNKFSIQSSISKYSIQNANINLLKDDFPIGEHAFHTAKEDNPWCIIDLEQSYPIEHIRVYNIRDIKYRERTKSLYVEISHNGIDWIKVSSELCSWEDKYFIFNAVLSQVYSARYVKLSLGERNYFHLSKVQVFTRKIPGYIISAKPDGFGARLGAIICGLYTANKSNMKFKFTWNPNTNDEHLGVKENQRDEKLNYISITMETVDKIFSDNFVKKHLIEYSKIESNFYSDIQKKTFSRLSEFPMRRKWGWYVNHVLPFLPDRIIDCDKEECLQGLKKAYNDIEFSQNFQNIIIDVEKKFNKYNKKFIAIHIRGGEIVLGKLKVAPEIWMNNRHFPYEVAIDIIFKELKEGNNIIIFGQDLKANEELKNYIYNEVAVEILTINDFIEYNYSDIEQVFFEMNFMAKASKIYSTGNSIFPQCAEMISGKKMIISFYDIYDNCKLYSVIENNIHCLKLVNLHKAYSYYRLCHLSRKLCMPINISLIHAENALREDITNGAWMIAIIDLLFLNKDIELANLRLRQYFGNGYVGNFFEALIGPQTTAVDWKKEYYNKIFQSYIQNASSKYPYISYVAIKICQHENKTDDAEKYFKYIKESGIDDKLFKELLKLEKIIDDNRG